jgi:hypothetical protein
MKKWKPLVRDEIDILNGYNLCHKCNGELEQLVDDDDVYKERCPKGCYCINLDTMKREY